jgi:phenylalanyl-tRNA synthetase beta chain
MIVSLNWLKKFTDIDLPVDELVKLIGSRLVEIEEVIDLGTKYKDVLVVNIVQTNKIEGSDHLSLTKIDDGGFVKNIERDENGLIQVVCGAPNVRQGQLVVWLPPASIVPSTYNNPEPFVLGSRKLCGFTSNGMIASARELDLYDEHEGILEIFDDVKPGTSFATIYELNDYLFDIENKSLTHRPDCFGIIGFAREVAAITGKSFHTPEWLMNLSTDFNLESKNEVELDVTIDNPELSERYLAIVMSGADGKKQSPMLVQTYLARVGVRPISAVVDVTNYLMMLSGQPLHAFDYDKLVAVGGGKADIHVRQGHDKESLELIGGKKIELSSEDIVIAAGDTVIGLAGAMGGLNTAIDENTKNIIIECATFNLYNLRATQMRHGIFSEAITRFTKGQPAELTAPVLHKAIQSISEWANAKCVSRLAESYPFKQEKINIEFSNNEINNILGSSFTDVDISRTLLNVEFSLERNESIIATVPYWRADIHIVEDIVEEVGRLNGYDNINQSLPTRDFTAVKPNNFDIFRHQLRKILVRAGANEVLSYSFVHGNMIEKSSQNISNSYRIANSISPDLQYYRQSLTPNLLDFVHPNIKQGYDNFAIFEINKAHSKSTGLNVENVPIESEMMALVISNKINISAAPYYQAKRIFEYLCDSLGFHPSYEILEKKSNNPVFGSFEGRRSAQVIDKLSGKLIGIVGEYKNSVIRGYKLPEYTAGFEIDLVSLFEIVNKLDTNYKPQSRYPSSERDICFQVGKDVSYSQIINSIENFLETIELESNISPVDIYQPEDGNTKNITIRVKLTSYDHTLTSDEVASVINSITDTVIQKTQATIV